MDANLFMVFYYDYEKITRFGYIISQKAFDTFIGSNQPTGTKLKEEDVTFPSIFMHGSTRRALVHYRPNGTKKAAYVPVFPTEAEVDKYSEAFRR